MLVDPDKYKKELLEDMLKYGEPDLWLAGGSYLTHGNMEACLSGLRMLSKKPLVIFPGTPSQISPKADALLLLSLVSGRNPEYLIGRHVESAFQLKNSGLELIPTAYLLIDGGKTTTAHYISQTQPIPGDKAELAAATALAATLMGMRLVYLDAGSGSRLPVSPDMIEAVRRSTEVPVVVGGGIRSGDEAHIAWKSGADVVVVGNALEKDHRLFEELIAAQKG